MNTFFIYLLAICMSCFEKYLFIFTLLDGLVVFLLNFVCFNGCWILTPYMAYCVQIIIFFHSINRMSIAWVSLAVKTFKFYIILYTMANIWKSKCPTLDKWIKNLWYIFIYHTYAYVHIYHMYVPYICMCICVYIYTQWNIIEMLRKDISCNLLLCWVVIEKESNSHIMISLICGI